MRSARKRREVSCAGGPVDGVTRDVDRRYAVNDPVRHDISDAAARQDPQRVHSGRDVVAVEFRGRPEHRPDVWREGLRPAEEQSDPDLGQRRNALERGAEVGADPIPVRRHGAEREAVRHTVQRPRGADRLEQANEHAVALGAVVAVAVGVLDHRQVVVHARDCVGDQVVVLGRLQRDADAVERAELAGPHACRVHHDLGLDAALVSVDRR